MPHPAKLNIGSGRDWLEDSVNVDINGALWPDVIADLSDPHLVGKEFYTTRFGRVVLEAGAFDQIRAAHVLEHVPDLVQCMTNCLALLREGGEMAVEVPYDLSHGAWQDPTHIRAFNERSWMYYSNWHWMIGWFDWRFDQVQNTLVLSSTGQELKRKGMADEDIRRTPRAVDVNAVLLRKRRLTDEEKAQGRRMAQPRATRIAQHGPGIPAGPVSPPRPDGPASVSGGG